MSASSAPATRRLRRGRGSPTAPPPRPLVAWVIAHLIRLFAMLPLWTIQAAGATIGRIAGLLPIPERTVAEINVGIAFPELAPAERRRLARRSMIETAKTFAEFSAAWCWSCERIGRHVRTVHGDAAIRRALANGRGVILAAPHLGSWEIGGIEVSKRFPMTTLYRRPRLAELEPLVKSGRERMGAELVPSGLTAVRTLLAALRRGELVAILPDQEPAEGMGIFVPFFGVQANTMTLLSKLAARTGALVVMGYAERLPRGRGFDLHFITTSDEIGDADLERSAAALNREVERCVRRCPEQYIWSYKRFRIRPPGGAKNPYAR